MRRLAKTRSSAFYPRRSPSIAIVSTVALPTITVPVNPSSLSTPFQNDRNRCRQVQGAHRDEAQSSAVAPGAAEGPPDKVWRDVPRRYDRGRRLLAVRAPHHRAPAHRQRQARAQICQEASRDTLAREAEARPADRGHSRQEISGAQRAGRFIAGAFARGVAPLVRYDVRETLLRAFRYGGRCYMRFAVDIAVTARCRDVIRVNSSVGQCRFAELACRDAR